MTKEPDDAGPDFGLNLTREERVTPLWLKVTRHLESKLATLRAQNDSLLLTEGETRNTRALISVYKQVLAAGRKPGRDDVASEGDPGSVGPPSGDYFGN